MRAGENRDKHSQKCTVWEGGGGGGGIRARVDGHQEMCSWTCTNWRQIVVCAEFCGMRVEGGGEKQMEAEEQWG